MNVICLTCGCLVKSTRVTSHTNFHGKWTNYEEEEK